MPALKVRDDPAGGAIFPYPDLVRVVSQNAVWGPLARLRPDEPGPPSDEKPTSGY